MSGARQSLRRLARLMPLISRDLTSVPWQGCLSSANSIPTRQQVLQAAYLMRIMADHLVPRSLFLLPPSQSTPPTARPSAGGRPSSTDAPSSFTSPTEAILQSLRKMGLG